MEFSALLTSAGINITVCLLFLSLYSILRKQPHNFNVYFGRRLAEQKFRQQVDYFSFERLLPTAGWIARAYWCTEEEIRRVAGLDSVVFLRLFIFSIRIFSITSLVCIFVVLPVNYHGAELRHAHIPAESLNVFTIANVKQGSRILTIHGCNRIKTRDEMHHCFRQSLNMLLQDLKSFLRASCVAVVKEGLRKDE